MQKGRPQGLALPIRASALIGIRERVDCSNPIVRGGAVFGPNAPNVRRFEPEVRERGIGQACEVRIHIARACSSRLAR
jgi:hypothetical protein